MLRPVAGFCLAHSIKLQEFIEITKRAFLDSASDELSKQGAQVSDSKLSIMTGLQRKDISRMKRMAVSEPEPENLATRIIGLWSSRQYAESNGKPRKLTIGGRSSQFARLVGLVSQDLNHHTVLFELQRLGLVSVKGDLATLKVPAFIVRGDIDKALPLLGADVRDLVDAVHENVVEDFKTPHLHAKTEYDNISTEHLSKIRLWLIQAGQRFHREAREFLGQLDRDTNPKLKPGNSRNRVSLGTFSFIESIHPSGVKKEEKEK